MLGYGMCHFLRVLFGWKINSRLYFVACNKFLGKVFSSESIFGSDCHGSVNYMLILLTLYKLCAIRIRHTISTSEDVQYKQVNHQVWYRGGTNQKYLPVNESLLLLIYQVKMASSLWQAAKINEL